MLSAFREVVVADFEFAITPGNCSGTKTASSR
jgi:hypothetical protein